jgi:hypothetical protein
LHSPGFHLREAKIQDLRLAPPRYENVCRFNIPVDDTLQMRGCQGIGNFNAEVEDIFDFQGLATDPVLQRLAFQ